MTHRFYRLDGFPVVKDSRPLISPPKTFKPGIYAERYVNSRAVSR